jgi:hypothetical protein
MANLALVLVDLQKRRTEIQKELKGLDSAVKALKGLAGENQARVGRRWRRLSTAARKRISDAQKARWAKFKKQKRV